jgi:hypothetical protein
MSSGVSYPLAVFIALCVAVLLAGCISTNIGETLYSDGGVTTHITNTGEPAEAYIQVTVYETRDLRQQEVTVLNTTVMLGNGENTVYVPGPLDPGRYKLYIYLIQNHDRKNAVIRDIVVT